MYESLTEFILHRFLIKCQRLPVLDAVAVAVNAEIFAGQNDFAVFAKGHVETLGVLDLALEAILKFTFLSEDSDVEVVMVVCDHDFSSQIDSDTDRIVGDVTAPNFAQKFALVREDHDTVSAIVADEDLFTVVGCNAVGELQVIFAVELLLQFSHSAEDADAHHLALHDEDTTFAIDGKSSWMLEHVRAELEYKLSLAREYLHLVRRRAFRDDNTSSHWADCHTIWIQQLALLFPILSKLELQLAASVEHLDTMVIGIGHENVTLRIHSNSAWLRELCMTAPVLAKSCVEAHLVAHKKASRG